MIRKHSNLNLILLDCKGNRYYGGASTKSCKLEELVNEQINREFKAFYAYTQVVSECFSSSFIFVMSWRWVQLTVVSKFLFSGKKNLVLKEANVMTLKRWSPCYASIKYQACSGCKVSRLKGSVQH